MTRKSLLPRLAGRATLWVGLLLASTTQFASAQALPAGCGKLSQSWGPFDYRAERYIWEPTYRSHQALLAIVENAHFTPEVEGLFRGKTGALPGGDLSYTLGVFPNHHRALISISNLGLKLKSPQPPETRFSIECYFARAMTFRPDDTLVRMIYANYLIQLEKKEAAEQSIDAVASTNPENPFTLRNLALLYFDAQKFDKSLLYAHKSAAAGLNIDAIKAKLVQAGKWKEPITASPELAASVPDIAPPTRKD